MRLVSLAFDRRLSFGIESEVNRRLGITEMPAVMDILEIVPTIVDINGREGYSSVFKAEKAVMSLREDGPRQWLTTMLRTAVTAPSASAVHGGGHPTSRR